MTSLPDRKADSDCESHGQNEQDGQKRSGPITAVLLPTAVDAHAHIEIQRDTTAIRALAPNTTEEPT